MLSMVLRLKVRTVLQDARFHFYKPRLSEDVAADRIVSLAEEYAEDKIRSDRETRSEENSVVLPELLSELENILHERDIDDMSDDMITISNIEIAVQAARAKVTTEDQL